MSSAIFLAVVPSPELVERVRDLYQKRVSDVRFLIPVLNGLSKKEVVAALPKLIKLNPVVVKEVFNRLLGTQNTGDFFYSIQLDDWFCIYFVNFSSRGIAEPSNAS
jgi:hypothetical protein